MQDCFTLSDSDRALIHALQIAPRASWSAVGEALHIDPVTAARRWQRLSDAGVAWVTTAPAMVTRSAQCLAYVEITCRPGLNLQVATILAGHPMALTVELTTGSADILVTVAAQDLRALSRFLLARIGQVDGVTGTRSRIATRLYSEGSSWRLGGLPHEAVDALRRHRNRPLATGGSPTSATECLKTLLTYLSLDGRSSYADLADKAGVSRATARRQVTRLLDSGAVLSRTDVSAPIAGWPVQAYLWSTTPVHELSETARELSQFRQTRLCASLAAAPSLVLSAWLRTVEEVHRLELSIAKKLPNLEVIDRLLVLRQVKRMGRLLDESGRATGAVPIQLWDDQADDVSNDQNLWMGLGGVT